MGHEVDSRIDILNLQIVFNQFEKQPLISMTSLIQENLVRMKAPNFDADLINSVTFIAKFKVTVYEEVYLKIIQ